MTGPVRLIIGLLEDKDARAWLETFDSPRFNIVLTRAPGHRAASPEMLLARYPFCYAMVEIESGCGRRRSIAL